MTAPSPSRPWWKRKRLVGAVALWLLATYPFSSGPMIYGVARGWVSPGVFAVAYAPLLTIAEAERPNGLVLRWRDYNGAAWTAGLRDAAASD